MKNQRTAFASHEIEADVLGPYQMGGSKRPNIADTVIGKGGNKGKKIRTDDSSLRSAEMTLEQRLNDLSSSLNGIEDNVFREDEDAINQASQSSSIYDSTIAAPTSDSLVTLIEQGLQSGDDLLLEQCLNCGDSDVVEETARRLSTAKVVLFLRKLVAKFEKRPSRGMLLTKWLSAVLRHHTSYLVTVGDLSYQLAGLSQMLEQRMQSYMKLSSLAGRLDLLLSQVSYTPINTAKEKSTSSSSRQRHKKSRSNSFTSSNVAPLQVYKEGEDDIDNDALEEEEEEEDVEEEDDSDEDEGGEDDYDEEDDE